MTGDTGYHAPVMVGEVLEHLTPRAGGEYLDGTLGGGGHAESILERDAGARVIGVDRDPEALAEAGRRLARFGERVRLVRANYSDAVEVGGITSGSLAGVLLDLGISSRQVDALERGFTFRPGAPLDMRMGQDLEEEPTAADLLNGLDEAELANVFFRYGEERRSRKLAREVVRRREQSPFERSEHLVEAIESALPRASIQDKARIFQALRIAVNRELEGLTSALPKLRDALMPGGVFVILSYHSLEDRLVKEAFRSWSRSCVCPPGFPVCRCRGEALGETLTRKPVFGALEEVERNPRARSARLRAWRRG